MGAGVKAAEHGRYTTPTDDVRRRHGLLPPRTGLIYRIMMAHGGVPHSHGELIHRSAWNRNSRKFTYSNLHKRAARRARMPSPGLIGAGWGNYMLWCRITIRRFACAPVPARPPQAPAVARQCCR